MMTRDELIEWMGNQNDNTYNGVNVVIDCPSKSVAQEVADQICSVLGGAFDADDGDDAWWRWLWLHLEFSPRKPINAYSSLNEWTYLQSRFHYAEVVPADVALSRIRCEIYAPAAVDDLL